MFSLCVVPSPVLIQTRVLRNDFARYNYSSVEESDDFGEF